MTPTELEHLQLVRITCRRGEDLMATRDKEENRVVILKPRNNNTRRPQIAPTPVIQSGCVSVGSNVREILSSCIAIVFTVMTFFP